MDNLSGRIIVYQTHTASWGQEVGPLKYFGGRKLLPTPRHTRQQSNRVWPHHTPPTPPNTKHKKERKLFAQLIFSKPLGLWNETRQYQITKETQLASILVSEQIKYFIVRISASILVSEQIKYFIVRILASISVSEQIKYFIVRTNQIFYFSNHPQDCPWTGG